MNITVNIVSYKYGHLVAQALESILGQSTQATAIRVWDDGVGDTVEPCRVYGIEPVVQLTRLGVVAHFQAALDATETEWVLMLGADNWLHRETIEEIERVCAWADIVSFDAKMVGEKITREYVQRFIQYKSGRMEDGYPIRDYGPSGIGVLHGSCAMRVSAARAVGGYERHAIAKDDIDAPANEDAALFDKMKANGATVLHIARPLLYYRKHRRNFGG